ncbi:hypothetical protein F0U44_13535 [Nocardioides humilatus]|uniref:Uncharacterized protein n=1 Tax=Nocardioides humilatus TaxID=2607660 RepID=A0A5B1LFB8_9ACTN|nr:hypothetical protein [Nocardioides humilatus]KAA1419451.1 hypothetical protein F0U44_13535 [Nocardioides humilatus]
MSGRGIAAAVAATVALGLSACTGEADSEEPERRAELKGCGPISYDDVVGRAPSYVDGPLDRTPNDHALCAGAWLPDTDTEFVPQGLVVRGREAWVSGYDEGDDGPFGRDTCRIIRLDVRTGREIAQQAPIEADQAPRDHDVCRHGGGLALDDHGLWMSQRTKIWLLDPATLDVVRVWHLVDEVWGSFLVFDDAGRLGVAGFSGHHPKDMHWFDVAHVLDPGRIDLTPDDAVAVQRGPKSGQGALWADLGPGPARVWFTRSNTHCGELWAGPRLRFAFHPGSEGVSYARDKVWVVSETTAAPYFLDGGRPVVPTVAQYDVSRFGRWERSDCGA